MKAVFLDRRSLDRDDLDLTPLRESLSSLVMHDATAPEQVRERLAGADVAIVNKVVLDEAALAACPSLGLICVVATGTNNIDLDAARRRGVAVVNCRGYGTDSLAQHVMALILALSRGLLHYARASMDGTWGRAEHFCLLDQPIRQIDGQMLGIVGFGTLGQAVGTLAEGLGMEVVAAERPDSRETRPGRLPLGELLRRSDIVTLHCPLTETTRNLIGERELRAMKSEALLINTARGGVVDEAALARALRQGWIAGAGVDVLSEEPPRNGNPLLDDTIPNLIVTPHCAWGSRQARQRIVVQTAENILGWRDGSPVRLVGHTG
ncbi:MAG TPA: 2-hydroxyacid dehydrogenase [Gammaproteobacteria bacterium]|nr:2-hydroxyacid dehydrogenase [Gammaproteobacteria bacterium]